MRVDATKQATLGRPGETPRDATLAPAEIESDSRALVVQPPTDTHQPSSNYRQPQFLAAFLAHLIAVKDQLPQTRERRRAEPNEAIAAYRAAAARRR